MSAALSLPAAAKYLGISPTSLRRARKAGKVSYIDHPFGGYRFRVEDLDAYLASCRVEPVPAIKPSRSWLRDPEPLDTAGRRRELAYHEARARVRGRRRTA
jgi:hypothetical protein